MPQALLLTAACTWLLNGLHARPDDGPACRNLMSCILPLTSATSADPEIVAYRTSLGHGRGADEEGDDEFDEYEDSSDDSDDAASSKKVPYNPFGVVFFRRLKLDVNVPRFRSGPRGRLLSEAAFRFFFHASQQEMQLKCATTGIIPREQIGQANYIGNRARLTSMFFHPVQDNNNNNVVVMNTNNENNTEDISMNGPQPSNPQLFDLCSSGYSLAEPEVDDGSDLENEGESSNNQNQNHGHDASGNLICGNIDYVMEQIWRQFLVDIVSKAPNMGGRSANSYLKLTHDERLRVGEELYKNRRLSDMWKAVQYRHGEKKDWELAFDHLFPPKGQAITTAIQNYTQCRYFRHWQCISTRNDQRTVDGMREAFYKRLLTLTWIPHACSDKMWVTSKNRNFCRLPHQTTGAAPRILVKAHADVGWVSA